MVHIGFSVARGKRMDADLQTYKPLSYYWKLMKSQGFPREIFEWQISVTKRETLLDKK